jgi:hypothetical protein
MPTLAGVSCSHRKKLNKDIRREASRWDNGSVEPSAFVINRMAVSQAVKVRARRKIDGWNFDAPGGEPGKLVQFCRVGR